MHFIVSHSIFIALCAVGLSFQTLQLFRLPIQHYLLAFIFFATITGYNAYWVVSKISLGRPASFSTILQNLRVTVAIIFIAAAGMLFSLLHLKLVWYNIIFTFLLLALYTLPLLPVKKIQAVRKAGFLKTALLAFTWTHVSILIPLQKPITHLEPVVLLLFAGRFLFMLMLCIIFDKRDITIDKIRGLHSLATDISPRTLHILMFFIYVIYTAIAFKMKTCGVAIAECNALVAAGTVALLVYFLSLKHRGYFFYYFIVDGLMILSALLTSIVSI